MARMAITQYTAEGMTVNGNLTVTGSVSATGGLTYTNISLTGNLQVDGNTVIGSAVGDTCRFKATTDFDEQTTFDKDIIVGTGASITAGGLAVVAGGVEITAGGLTVTAGDVELVADDLLVDAGDVTVTLGDVDVAAGDLSVTLGSITVGLAVTAGTTVQGADLVATDDLTVGDDVQIGGDVAISGNCGVLGTLTCATFAPANINTTNIVAGGTLQVTGQITASAALTVGTTLQVTGKTDLDGAVDLGDAAGDDIVVAGSVASDINFKTGAARQILGPASNDLTIQAPAGRALVLQSNAGTVLSLSAAGAINPAANIQFTLAGACSITSTAGQNMSLLSAGAGNTYVGSAGSATAITVLAAGGVQVTQAAQFDAAINPQTDITFGGAVAHAITGVAAQTLTIGALTTGVLTVETATGNLVLQSDNAAAAITISGAADLITLGSPLTTTETIAKTGTANGGAVTVKVAEGLHNVVGGGLTETIANAIPAGSLVLTAIFRVTTVIASAGGASWDAGVGGATTRYAENLAFAADTTSTMADHVAASSPMFYKVATDIVLTLDAGTWTSGAIRWKVFYIDSTAIAS